MVHVLDKKIREHVGLCCPTQQLRAPRGYLNPNLSQLKWNEKFSSSVTLVNIQAVSSHVWLVATMLDSAYHFSYCRKFSWAVLL